MNKNSKIIKLTVLSVCTALLSGCHLNTDDEIVTSSSIDMVTTSIDDEIVTSSSIDMVTTSIDERNELPSIQVDDNETIRYSYGFRADYKQSETGEINVEYTVKNSGSAMSVGLMAFINGIPQKIQDGEKETYITFVEVEAGTNSNNTNKVEKYIISPNSNVSEAYGIRFASMLLPEVYVTNDKNYYPGFRRSIFQIGSNPVNEVVGDNLEIKDLQPNLVEENKKNVTGSMGYFNSDKSLNQTVLNRKELEGYNLSLCAEEGNYILSFWGDNEPIQVGEAMYYRVSLDPKSNNIYDFKLDKEKMEEIDNLFFVICPEGTEGQISVGAVHILISE